MEISNKKGVQLTMKKRILTLAVAGIMALSATITSFAGQWKQEAAGWWYQNDDGSFLKDGWNWVDGSCYYFTSDGYCLINTVTPDGYQVDGSGAWIVDGVVQTQTPPAQTKTEPVQQNAVQVDTLSFVPPAGFTFASSEENNFYFVNQTGSAAIVVSSEAMEGWGEEEVALGGAIQEPLLNAAIEITFGTPQSKEARQYTSGTWYRYQFADGTMADFPGAVVVFARITGNRVQMVAAAGDLSGLDVDSMMNNCLK